MISFGQTGSQNLMERFLGRRWGLGEVTVVVSDFFLHRIQIWGKIEWRGCGRCW